MNTRMLKVEETDYIQTGKIKPVIRLKGYWLNQAGFPPGSHVSVTCIAPGVIELRSDDSAYTKNSPLRQKVLSSMDDNG